MATVAWLPAAFDDLHDIQRYIARESPQTAAQIVARIVAATRTLSAFPRGGRVVSEVERLDIRELIVQGFRVIYRVTGDAVTIFAVRHAARLLDDIHGL
jgi:toxin ParE1/3/4